MVIFIGKKHGALNSNPGQGCLLFHGVNTFGKGINQTTLPPAMGKIVLYN